MLSSIPVPNGHPLPDWAETLNSVLGRFAIHPLLEEDRAFDRANPVPFQELLLPFLDHARDCLERQIPPPCRECLTEIAWSSLDRQLLETLSVESAIALSRQFRIFLAIRDPLAILPQAVIDCTEPPSRVAYGAFLEEMVNGGLKIFFQEFAVLARALAQRVEQWIAFVCEFCQRLVADWPLLTHELGAGKDLGPVVMARPGLSDRHNSGRSVISLWFKDGLELVYKPRDIATEAAFFALLEWLNVGGSPCTQKVLKVLNRGTHGWVERAQYTPCGDCAAAKRYYYRAGGLLSVIYALAGTDCHCENLISFGEFPVLVDMETLFHPRAKRGSPEERQSVDAHAESLMDDSVFGTGLLPVWETGRDGKCFDISGFGAVENQLTGVSVQTWKHINSDGMILAFREGVNGSQENCPFRDDGTNIGPVTFVEDMAAGLTGMYRFLLTNRGKLLGERGPLSAFAQCRLRFILRPTSIYSTLLEKLRHPEYLRDGVDRGLEIEVLAQSAVTKPRAQELSIPWSVYQSEVYAIERCDVPHFDIWPTSRKLSCDGQVLADDFFEETPLSRVQRRLAAMSEDDLTAQVALLRGAIHARFDSSLPGVPGIGTLDSQNGFALDNNEFISEAVGIAEAIQSRAIQGSDGCLNWISLFDDPETDRLRLEPLGYTFYNGRCGLAVFFAALSGITGRGDFRDSAVAAIRPLLHPHSFDQHRLYRLGIGGASGTGGIVYGLFRVAESLNNEEILDSSVRIAGAIAMEQIAQDRAYDVIAGAAGAILGLLSLYRVVPRQPILDRAIACGRHLLTCRVVSRQGYKVWPSIVSLRPLTGFSHGAAGIALALLRLSQAAACSEYVEAAREAIAFETATYSPAHRNWPDFRQSDPATGESARFMGTWCHGAPESALLVLGASLACQPIRSIPTSKQRCQRHLRAAR